MTEAFREVSHETIHHSCNLCTAIEEEMWAANLSLANGLYIDMLCGGCYEAVLMALEFTAMAIIMDHGGVDRLEQERYNL